MQVKYINYISNFPLASTTVFITIVPIIIMILNRSWEIKRPLRFFFLYLLFGRLCIDLVAFYLASNRLNSLAWCNASVIIGYLSIALIFNSVFLDDKTKNLIKILSGLFILIFFCDLFYSNENLLDFYNHRYVSFSTSLRSGLIIFFCLIFYRELIKELYIPDLSRSAMFYIVSGLFIYHSVSVFTTVLYNACYRWNFNHGMNSILHIPYYFEILFILIASVGLIRVSKSSYLEN